MTDSGEVCSIDDTTILIRTAQGTSRHPDVAIRLHLTESMLFLVDGDCSSTTIALRHRLRRVSNRFMC
jgi:hypothetical protein